MLHIIYGFSQKILMDEFSSKSVCVTPQNWKKLNSYSWFLMDEFSSKRPVWRPRIEISKQKFDEFSSKTACVTIRKMKISENFLDEYSMICQ